jgi:protein-disulfide isomerase
MKTAITLFSLSVSMMLAAGSYAQEQPSAKPGGPVAIVGGQVISEQDLIETVGPQLMQLRNQEYDIKSKGLESLIRQKLVDAEAKKRGITPLQLMEQEVDSKVPEPGDAEVEAYFWGQNRAGARFEDVKDRFRAALKQIRIQKAREAYADSLRAKTEVAVMLHAPTVSVAYDPARVKGDRNAPITIVEFADYQCPYCKKSEETIRSVLAKYRGRVKLSFRDFPLEMIHSRAEKAAEAARCAGEQGKYWEYHDALFADQSKLDDSSLADYARALKLDERAFQGCLAGGKFRSAVESDVREATRVGVSGTPAYFINGVFLNGAQPQAEFEKIIDSLLGTE